MLNVNSVVSLNGTFLTGREYAYIGAAMAGALSGDGPFTARASALVGRLTGAGRTLLTCSCTSALDMCGLLLDLRPGDEVIVPSFAFVSTATAFVLRGAVPVFVDCRPDTLNIDERLIEAAITPRTRAIAVVHYAGVACEMDTILAVARRHGLTVIEDNAHGLGGSYRGRPLGSLGALATQSFHATKNVQCGEGGALLVNDLEFATRAEIIREKGTNRGQFFRGAVDKYTWVDVGSSFLPSELLAAFLTAQLEGFDDIQRRRHAVWSAYHSRLARWAAEQGVGQPTVPDGCTHPAHLYYLLLPDLANRQALLAHLERHAVLGAFHYQPLHTSTGGRHFGRVAAGGCPVAERTADRLLRLPLHAGLTTADVDQVVDAVLSFEVTR